MLVALTTSCAAMTMPYGRARVGTAIIDASVASTVPNNLELCILSAHSEDEVQECLLSSDMHEDAIGARASDEELSPLEECILYAANEDKVQACIRAYEDRDDLVNEAVGWTAEPIADNADSSLTQAMEACILAANSEDEVQACMLRFDQENENTDAAPTGQPASRAKSMGVRGRGVPKMFEMSSEPVSDLEACIIDAKSEDEVGACVQRFDENDSLPETTTKATARQLGDCLRNARTKAQIDECVLESDDADEHIYG